VDNLTPKYIPQYNVVSGKNGDAAIQGAALRAPLEQFSAQLTNAWRI
jgi:hypothetical protein